MIVDAFTHILPPVCADKFANLAQGEARNFLASVARIPALVRLDDRFRVTDGIEGYKQVLTLSAPPIESLAQGAVGRDFARLANDEMAAIVQRYPDHFVGFAASLPMDDVDSALVEAQRAVNDLGGLGVQVFTNVNGHGLDTAAFEPFWETVAAARWPVWVHGGRSSTTADYLDESASSYGLWQSLGWPYEMALFMARMVLSGVSGRYPALRFVVHHGGGMIPFFGQRVGRQGQGLGRDVLSQLKGFYADTTVNGVQHVVQGVVDFFGTGHVLFATDMPFGPDQGLANLHGNLAAIERLPLPVIEKQQILSGNAQHLLARQCCGNVSP
ncbi:MAG: amidohydrolase family protein [Chloroflexi bacterium]|nr:amidohydrolase family protein [Chloroflexota bacterium]